MNIEKIKSILKQMQENQEYMSEALDEYQEAKRDTSSLSEMRQKNTLDRFENLARYSKNLSMIILAGINEQ